MLPERPPATHQRTISSPSIDRFCDGEEISKDKLTIFAQDKDDPDSQIFVFFPKEAKVGVKKIKEYAEKMKDAEVSSAILVVPVALTAFAKSALQVGQSRFWAPARRGLSTRSPSLTLACSLPSSLVVLRRVASRFRTSSPPSFSSSSSRSRSSW